MSSLVIYLSNRPICSLDSISSLSFDASVSIPPANIVLLVISSVATPDSAVDLSSTALKTQTTNSLIILTDKRGC